MSHNNAASGTRRGYSAADSRTTIQLKSVSKSYGTMLAVSDFSFNVRQGEMLVLLGPSGCGKTTTLRLIAGLEEPDDGAIFLDDQQVAGGQKWIPPEERRIGMVFQDYALFPHLTVAGNVAFGLNRLRGGERNERVKQMLALVGLPDVGERYPHQLSGGQQQRVALARAVASDPSVILLDEPFSNLDAALRKDMRDEVRRVLRTSGTTSVFVTHDQQEALSLADRIAVIFGGTLEQIDTPRMVYENPATRRVAAFVGEANFIPADATGKTANSPLGRVPLHEPVQGPVELLIRPETLLVSETKWDGTKAEVLWRDYYGYDQRVGLKIDGYDKDLIARIEAGVDINAGDTVYVTVNGAVKAFGV